MRPSSVWLERIPDKDEVQSSILWAATNIDAYSNTFFIRTENPEVVSSSLTGTHSGLLSSDGRASKMASSYKGGGTATSVVVWLVIKKSDGFDSHTFHRIKDVYSNI